MLYTCEHCKAPFDVKPSRRQRFCSRKCKSAVVNGAVRRRIAEARASDIETLLAANSERRGDCLLWTGNRWNSGYGRISLRGKPYVVSRVVWERSNGRALRQGEIVCHRCDTPACIEPSHLFVGAPADNSADMLQKGRQANGARQWKARLTAERVCEIRAQRRSGRKNAEIAAEFGVSASTVSNICVRKTWRHVP